MADQQWLYKDNQMKNANEIKNIIIKYGKIIESPKNLLKVFTDPQPDGAPYIKISQNQYHYIIEERGNILQERKTESLDLLIYWIINDIIFKISTAYELEHRKKAKDSRRLIFEYELYLFEKTKTEWYDRKKQEIEKTLIDSPYQDNT